MRSVGSGRCLIAFLDLFSAAMSQTALCLFFPFQGLVVLQQVWCYNNNYHNFYMFYIRSLAVARFD